MKIQLEKKKKKPKNRRWFAWRPVIAIDRAGIRYLIWWEDVFRAKTLNLITYHILERRKRNNF